jgi:hypothetical protein
MAIRTSLRIGSIICIGLLPLGSAALVHVARSQSPLAAAEALVNGAASPGAVWSLLLDLYIAVVYVGFVSQIRSIWKWLLDWDWDQWLPCALVCVVISLPCLITWIWVLAFVGMGWPAWAQIGVFFATGCLLALTLYFASIWLMWFAMNRTLSLARKVDPSLPARLTLRDPHLLSLQLLTGVFALCREVIFADENRPGIRRSYLLDAARRYSDWARFVASEYPGSISELVRSVTDLAQALELGEEGYVHNIAKYTSRLCEDALREMGFSPRDFFSSHLFSYGSLAGPEWLPLLREKMAILDESTRQLKDLMYLFTERLESDKVPVTQALAELSQQLLSIREEFSALRAGALPDAQLQDSLAALKDTQCQLAGCLQTLAELARSMSDGTPGQEVVRHTKVHFPSHCRAGEKCLLTVQLTVDRPGESAGRGIVGVPLPPTAEPALVTVQVTAPHFAIAPAHRCVIAVPSGEDSTTATFQLTPDRNRPGARGIEIELFCAGGRIGHFLVRTTVDDAEGIRDVA